MKTSFFPSQSRAQQMGELTASSHGPHAFRPTHIVRVILLSLGSLPLLPSSIARAEEATPVVAVYSSVSPAYTRTRLPGGGFKAETYAFGDGGNLGGAQKDFTIDKMSFLDVARLIAPSLGAKNYLPCNTKDPSQTNLLIMVYWGTTTGADSTSSSPQYQTAQSLIPPPSIPPIPIPQGGANAMKSDPSSSGRAQEGQVNAMMKVAEDSALQQSTMLASMANRGRDRQDRENASILGYMTEIKRVENFNSLALNRTRQDVVEEVEESRYFVVLMAYDFQTLINHKQRKLLWETRFSIPQRRSNFNKQLAEMAQTASGFFGQNSDGLVRKPLPTGHVDFGELKSLGAEP